MGINQPMSAHDLPTLEHREKSNHPLEKGLSHSTARRRRSPLQQQQPSPLETHIANCRFSLPCCGTPIANNNCQDIHAVCSSARTTAAARTLRELQSTRRGEQQLTATVFSRLDLVPGLGDEGAAGHVHRVQVSRARSARDLDLLAQGGVQLSRLRARLRSLGHFFAKRRHLE